MGSTIFLFWLLVTVVAVSATWSNYLARMASEKTIRQAIDKGLILDPAVIDKLRPPYRKRWDIRLVVTGILIGFAGLGIALFAVLLSQDDAEALFPVLSIAAVPTLTGIGFVIAGAWLRRQPQD
jgi:hypothetical protein